MVGNNEVSFGGGSRHEREVIACCDTNGLVPEIVIAGKFVKVVKLRNEWYDFVEDPAEFISALKKSNANADLFTFLQEPDELQPKYPFYLEYDSVSVVPISTYENWLKKQINDKTRNMIRKAAKAGVELRPVELDANFIEGVVGIYNESPVRQGKRFWHYGMNALGVRAHLNTFAERSHFVGAFHGGELIGFFKLTRNKNSASLMQIISKVAHRDKAPNNALLAKAVEMCAESEIPYLQYGIWSHGGLGDYKRRHGFVAFDVPRYYIALSAIGRVVLGRGLHRGLAKLIPETFRNRLLSLREKWYSYRYR